MSKKEFDITQEDDDAVSEELRRQADLFPKAYTILEKFESTVHTNLPKNLNKLVRHIMKYVERNYDILYTPYPVKYPIWRPCDTAIYYEVTGVDETEFRQTVANIKVPEKYTMKKAFIENKSVHAMELLILREMVKSKVDKNYIEYMCRYMGYSHYWQAYTVSFRKYTPNRQIVEYTINNLSNRFLLKRLGSVEELIKHSAMSGFETYKEDILEGSDFKTFIWVCDRLTTKFKGYVKGFAKPIYDNSKNKNAIFKMETLGDEGARENSSAVSEAITYADKYTNELFANPVNYGRVEAIAKNREVSATELRNAITSVLDDNKNYDDVLRFLQALFYIFIVTEKCPPKYIKTKRFIYEMDRIYKKGNSNDKNVEIAKFYLDKWLKTGSRTYRTSKRPDTINKFRRALFEYFIYYIGLS